MLPDALRVPLLEIDDVVILVVDDENVIVVLVLLDRFVLFALFHVVVLVVVILRGVVAPLIWVERLGFAFAVGRVGLGLRVVDGHACAPWSIHTRARREMRGPRARRPRRRARTSDVKFHVNPSTPRPTSRSKPF